MEFSSNSSTNNTWNDISYVRKLFCPTFPTDQQVRSVHNQSTSSWLCCHIKILWNWLTRTSLLLSLKCNLMNLLLILPIHPPYALLLPCSSYPIFGNRIYLSGECWWNNRILFGKFITLIRSPWTEWRRHNLIITRTGSNRNQGHVHNGVKVLLWLYHQVRRTDG